MTTTGKPVTIKPNFRHWLSTQTDHTGHLGELARHAERYRGRWSSDAELLERMVAYGVDPDSPLFFAIPDAAISFQSLNAENPTALR